MQHDGKTKTPGRGQNMGSGGHEYAPPLMKQKMGHKREHSVEMHGDGHRIDGMKKGC